MTAANDWRSLLSAEELSAFDANPGTYRHDEISTIEPRRNHIPLIEAAHAAETADTPEVIDLSNLLESLDALGTLAANCHLCHKPLNDTRVSVLPHNKGEMGTLMSFCRKCLDIPSPACEDTMTTNQSKARRLFGEGVKQSQIAKQLGITQSAVSKMLHKTIN